MAKNENKTSARSDTTQPKKSKQRSEEYLEYQRYIRGKFWKENIRDKVLERDGHRCRCCQRTEDEAPLSVHHSTYDILYHELEGDNIDKLITLCKYCHNSIHKCPSNYKRFSMKKGALDITSKCSPQHYEVTKTILCNKGNKPK